MGPLSLMPSPDIHYAQTTPPLHLQGGKRKSTFYSKFTSGRQAYVSIEVGKDFQGIIHRQKQDVCAIRAPVEIKLYSIPVEKSVAMKPGFSSASFSLSAPYSHNRGNKILSNYPFGWRIPGKILNQTEDKFAFGSGLRLTRCGCEIEELQDHPILDLNRWSVECAMPLRLISICE